MINYLYHPLMLRVLSLEEFSAFGSLVGVINILGILLSGVGLFLTREVAQSL